MWSSLPDTAHQFLSGNDVPVHISHIDDQPDIPEEQLVVTGVCQRDEETLFVRSAKGGRNWELPGGRVEDEETPREALDRELEEETGRTVTAAEPGLVLIWAFPESTIVQFVFLASLGETVRERTDEIAEVKWFDEQPDSVSFGELGASAYELVFDLDDLSPDDRHPILQRLPDPPSSPSPSWGSVAAGAVAGGIIAAGVLRRAKDTDSDE